MPVTEAVIARLVDEAAIRDVTARFADAATRGDYTGLRATLADDAEWSIGDQVHDVGADAILATFERLRNDREFFVQFAAQGPISIDGDEATASCIVHESARGPGEVYYRNHCMVSDRLRRSGDAWLFTNRVFRYLWLDTTAFGGQGFPY